MNLTVYCIFTYQTRFYLIILPWFFCDMAKDEFVIELKRVEKTFLSKKKVKGNATFWKQNET